MRISLLASLLALAACGESGSPATGPASGVDAFMDAIAQYCGRAFAGRVVANTPPPAVDDFAGQDLVMHVRECSDNEIRIPFHVGDDHSRTWILTRTDSGSGASASGGLRLKHDHRHEDGSDDAVTMYGGDTMRAGTSMRQEFPVDQFSIDMFGREGLSASLTNVWAMEIHPGQHFYYELARTESDRLFRVEFDLTREVPQPPTPWGHPELP